MRFGGTVAGGKILSGQRGRPDARQRILVAEDESLIALELETALIDLGYDVIGPVSRVQDVVQHVEAGGLDGALLDVKPAQRADF